MTGKFKFESNRGAQVSEAERALLLKYPLLYRAIQEPEAYQTVLGHWGLQCGAGWYAIIDAASAKIEIVLREILAGFDVRQHLTHIERKLQDLRSSPSLDDDGDWEDDAKPLLPICVQIKEKLGSLCFYMQSGLLGGDADWECISAAIEEAEHQARTTCEGCGQPGSFRLKGWLRVTCDACEKKRKKDNDE